MHHFRGPKLFIVAFRDPCRDFRVEGYKNIFQSFLTTETLKVSLKYSNKEFDMKLLRITAQDRIEGLRKAETG